jgi:hypothetical protein
MCLEGEERLGGVVAVAVVVCCLLGMYACVVFAAACNAVSTRRREEIGWGLGYAPASCAGGAAGRNNHTMLHCAGLLRGVVSMVVCVARRVCRWTSRTFTVVAAVGKASRAPMHKFSLPC